VPHNQARRLLCVAALAASALAGAPAAQAQAQDTNDTIVRRINAVRAHHGIAPLRTSVALERAATAHCAEMLALQGLTHAALGQRLEQYVAAETVGETVAWMPTAAPGRVVRAWLRSPGHRAVLLSRTFHRIGVAAAPGSLGGSAGTSFTADLAT
jgi:uncharacterized protein YkwD